MGAGAVVVLLAAAVCALAGLGVPGLIARIPEPEPHPEDDVAPVGPVAKPEVGTKEAYAAIADLPGLALRAAVASGLAGALVGWTVGRSWELLYLLPLVPIGVALTVVDWRTRLLPTKVIAPSYLLVVVGVLACFAIERDVDDLTRAGLGWLVAGGFFWLLWRVYPRGMGYGDVRLSGVLGIALGQLGWVELVAGLYASFLLGGVIGGVLSLLRVVDRKGYPFGPFMLLGALAGLVLGHVGLDALTL